MLIYGEKMIACWHRSQTSAHLDKNFFFGLLLTADVLSYKFSVFRR